MDFGAHCIMVKIFEISFFLKSLLNKLISNIQYIFYILRIKAIFILFKIVLKPQCLVKFENKNKHSLFLSKTLKTVLAALP